MQLIITRHGHTPWNDFLLMQGRSDNNLSKKGEEQARKLAKRLSKEKIDIIYSSPLKRALNTAKIIKKLLPGAELIIENDLVEMNFGVVDGMSREEILAHKEHGPMWRKRERERYTFVIPKGESWEQVHVRTKKFLKRIIQANRDALVISHGVVSKALLLELTKDNFTKIADMNYKNTGVSKFIIDGGKVKIVELNCDKHLREE
ncbi:2,3-bisphosphoglycerate-dependent phosphoglycerate mutase [uncultured archaeon]|nr:2,3-bisphosphoglycerate-dependent phosphoglycerate mutase [uncultured archaeon]